MKDVTALEIHQISLPTPWPAVGPVHVYVVREDPVTLIDTGVDTPESREALLTGLRALRLEVRDIRRVLMTHAHQDHYGQTGWLQEVSGAEVWLHPDEAGKVHTPDWWIAARDRALTEAGVPPEVQALIDRYWRRGRRLARPLARWQAIGDGQRFRFERGELQAVHLPGHALGHTGFFDPETGVLVGGDHLLLGVTPNPIMEPLPDGHPTAVPHAPYRALTLGLFLDALRRVKRLPVRRVLPGHGPEIDDHITVADGYLARHERRLSSLLQRLGDGRTAFDLTQEVYPRAKELDIFLALSEVLAHLDLMVVQGRAVVAPDGRVAVYRQAA